MANVLKNCLYSIRVRYLEKFNLPENNKYKTKLFCDEVGNDFHKNIINKLDKKITYNK